jgi:hypothetical protein
LLRAYGGKHRAIVVVVHLELEDASTDGSHDLVGIAAVAATFYPATVHGTQDVE